MYLKNVKIFMNHNMCDKIYRSHFHFHVFFIVYYLSQHLKKDKFLTDGTFDTINIEVGLPSASIELENRSLTINLPFDFKLYDNADETVRCKYYIDLLKIALQIANERKNIPFEKLMEYLTSLADNNFIYSWNFKDVIVPEYNLKIRFICQLSTNDFIMKIMALDKNTMNPICEGNILRTKPDEIFFSYISKKIKIKDGKIIIFSKWDTELLSIELKSLVSGDLVVDFSSTPYPDDIRATENFKQLQKELKYDNYGFI